jgi:hypothetical protein
VTCGAANVRTGQEFTFMTFAYRQHTGSEVGASLRGPMYRMCDSRTHVSLICQRRTSARDKMSTDGISVRVQDERDQSARNGHGETATRDATHTVFRTVPSAWSSLGVGNGVAGDGIEPDLPICTQVPSIQVRDLPAVQTESRKDKRIYWCSTSDQHT